MSLTIRLPDRPGRCRWCGCTELRACEGGCSWANAAQTVCSECHTLDLTIRSAAGRRYLAAVIHLGLSVMAVPARKRAR